VVESAVTAMNANAIAQKPARRDNRGSTGARARKRGVRNALLDPMWAPLEGAVSKLSIPRRAWLRHELLTAVNVVGRAS
jgi:hypothetical protein